MENGDDESGQPRETVMLILKEERFEVEKQKLVDKSQYFAALLSANYVEYGRTEHVINYDIPPVLLQDFVDWIHNDKIAFASATSYEELDRLLILLELSILFAVDSLTENIIDRLEMRFMLPEYAINVWVLAQELNVNLLRDLSLAICLDRFDELPVHSIYELSRENFLKLIGNVNVRSTTTYLLRIINEWMDRHQDFTFPLDYLLENRNKRLGILHGIVSCESNKSDQFIHCWDGKDFFELTSFKYPKDITERSCNLGKSLEGAQITARMYDLYLCGGEYGIGSGKFNKDIWRYSLISKKWYYETAMPAERRHMITVVFENKLLLMGGVGRYRQKLQTVDIYDIYAGTWTSGATLAALQFTNVPEYFIYKDKLIIYHCMPSMYIYFLNEDVWETERCRVDFKPDKAPDDLPILTLESMPCYIDVIDQDEIAFRAITETCDCNHVEDCNHNIIKPLPQTFDEAYEQKIVNYFLRIKCNSLSLIINPLFGGYNYMLRVLLCTDFHTYSRESSMLYLQSISIRNPRKFRSLTLLSKKCSLYQRFFQLIHPAQLHATSLDRI